MCGDCVVTVCGDSVCGVSVCGGSVCGDIAGLAVGSSGSGLP